MKNKTKFWRRREPQQAMLASLTPATRERLKDVPLGRLLKASFTRILPAPSFLALGMCMLSEGWREAQARQLEAAQYRREKWPTASVTR